VSEAYWNQPKFGIAVLTLDVDVLWFLPFVAEEKEPKAFDTQYCWHLLIEQPL
jgi:hypothetical protein